MQKSDQPLGLIGFLFALSIGFWGNHMANFYKQGPLFVSARGPASAIAVRTSLPGTQVGVAFPLEGERERRWELAQAIVENNEGVAHQEQVKLIEAIGNYGTAIERNPGFALAYYNQGTAFQEQARLEDIPPRKTEQLKRAIDNYDKALALRPDFAEAYYNRGLVLEEEGQLEGAIVNYKRAVSFKSDFPEARTRLVAALRDVGRFTFDFRWTVWFLTLVAGVVFLADIVCVMWWYSKYIYKIQTIGTLSTYFLDFGVCAMFNVAANKWTNPKVFLVAAALASALLIVRFFSLYRSPDANDTDRRILQTGGAGLAFAIVICLAALWVFFYATGVRPASEGWVEPLLVMVLSIIGIILTIFFRDKIAASAQIHENSNHRFEPMQLQWPQELKTDINSTRDIMHATRKGLERFRELFRGRKTELEHNRLRSQVHSEADLRVQGYILAIPSWTPNEEDKVKTDEVEKKAFMVGMSHWLDDLVDGRGDLEVYKRLKKAGKNGYTYGLTIDSAAEVFKEVYGRLIVNHTNRAFLPNVIDRIEHSTEVGENQKYLFFSLNRVAIGAAIFGPKVKEDRRNKLLTEHNKKLVEMIKREQQEQPESKYGWYQETIELLTSMEADASGLGKVLMGLTTKTVQEMAMASEGQIVSFALSVLYSILYAPLLYFHDIDDELERNEMVPLETFDVNYEGIVSWLQRMRMLVERDDGPADPRRDSRLEQLEMAFKCFRPNMPELAIEFLTSIYVSKGQFPQLQLKESQTK